MARDDRFFHQATVGGVALPYYTSDRTSLPGQPTVHLGGGGSGADGQVLRYPEARVNGEAATDVVIVIDGATVVHFAYRDRHGVPTCVGRLALSLTRLGINDVVVPPTVDLYEISAAIPPAVPAAVAMPSASESAALAQYRDLLERIAAADPVGAAKVAATAPSLLERFAATAAEEVPHDAPAPPHPRDAASSAPAAPLLPVAAAPHRGFIADAAAD